MTLINLTRKPQICYFTKIITDPSLIAKRMLAGMATFRLYFPGVAKNFDQVFDSVVLN